MFLSDCKRGDKVEIVDITDNWGRTVVIPFGIVKGSKVICQAVIPNGPVVIKKGQGTIALGYPLASKILVKRRWG
ncbi:FeoA domain-containing protein [Anaerobranca californiensis DSM 14826]|jgi:Fe2+ transport system protein FeoA|uniref:FeoA domain-containing protein n=1 Tax=Anaerobranca californiensis DSM 14826 TaxID=1120989 RepID=A0A1M6MI21_9FIRM|nr:FeoA family protein [Anaerobranca californiensis]SHJ82960.1 FeoA domain-containing protein [Anaerobranca californiensis DSM 14826]